MMTKDENIATVIEAIKRSSKRKKPKPKYKLPDKKITIEDVYKSKYVLCQNGVIKNSYWLVAYDDVGSCYEEFRHFDRDENDNLCVSYEEIEKIKGIDYFSAMYFVPVIACARTKKALIELRKNWEIENDK